MKWPALDKIKKHIYIFYFFSLSTEFFPPSLQPPLPLRPTHRHTTKPFCRCLKDSHHITVEESLAPNIPGLELL